MHYKKVYGQSRIDNCPFCDKKAVIMSLQGVSVCIAHKNSELSNLKCACGEWLDVMSGKWGPYFRCMNCGNINFRKGMEMNPDAGKGNNKNNQQKENNYNYNNGKENNYKANKSYKEKETNKEVKETNKYNKNDYEEKEEEETKKEITIRSDELDFFGL